jgi:hypothetical protein
MSGEMITLQAITHRIKVQDGTQDCKYAIMPKEKAKAKASFPRKEKGILVILTGQFQSRDIHDE